MVESIAFQHGQYVKYEPGKIYVNKSHDYMLAVANDEGKLCNLVDGTEFDEVLWKSEVLNWESLDNFFAKILIKTIFLRGT